MRTNPLYISSWPKGPLWTRRLAGRVKTDQTHRQSWLNIGRARIGSHLRLAGPQTGSLIRLGRSVRDSSWVVDSMHVALAKPASAYGAGAGSVGRCITSACWPAPWADWPLGLVAARVAQVLWGAAFLQTAPCEAGQSKHAPLAPNTRCRTLW